MTVCIVSVCAWKCVCWLLSGRDFTRTRFIYNNVCANDMKMEFTNLIPTQLRGPCPKGSQAILWRFFTRSGSNLSGTKDNGSSGPQCSGSKCTSSGLICEYLRGWIYINKSTTSPDIQLALSGTVINSARLLFLNLTKHTTCRNKMVSYGLMTTWI